MFLVPLSQGMYATIDDEDAERVLPYKWTAQKSKRTFYAYRRDYKANRKIYLHRLLMNDPHALVDHVDGNGLNCVRANMRSVDHAQNRANARRTNKHGARGVRAWGTRWAAYIKDGSRAIKLGVYDTVEEAAEAYRLAAQDKYGEYAP